MYQVLHCHLNGLLNIRHARALAAGCASVLDRARGVTSYRSHVCIGQGFDTSNLLHCYRQVLWRLALPRLLAHIMLGQARPGQARPDCAIRGRRCWSEK